MIYKMIKIICLIWSYFGWRYNEIYKRQIKYDMLKSVQLLLPAFPNIQGELVRTNSCYWEFIFCRKSRVSKRDYLFYFGANNLYSTTGVHIGVGSWKLFDWVEKFNKMWRLNLFWQREKREERVYAWP